MKKQRLIGPLVIPNACACLIVAVGAIGCGAIVSVFGDAGAGPGPGPGPEPEQRRPTAARVSSSMMLEPKHRLPAGVAQAWSVGGWNHDADGRGDLCMKRTKSPADPAAKSLQWRGEYYLATKCPDRNTTGILMLDREGPDFRVVKKGPGQRNWADVVKVHNALFDWFRVRRPKARIGFYAYPDNRLWEQNDAWREAWLAYPVFEKVDVILPSVYKWSSTMSENDIARVENAVRFALEIGAKHDKPVHLVVTHRYTGKDEFAEIIPDAEFIEYVTRLLNIDFEGKQCEGVYCWAADEYYHGAKSKGYYEVIERNRGRRPVDDHLTRVYERFYANALKAVAAQKPARSN